MDAPVPGGGQRRPDGGFLSLRNTRSGGRQAISQTCLSECRPPRVFARDGLRSYPAAIRELQNEGHVHRHCRQRTRRYCNNRIESDHRAVKRRLRAMQGPRTVATARAVIQGIEAVNMIRKGQVLGITRQNLYGQAWVLGAVLQAR